MPSWAYYAGMQNNTTMKMPLKNSLILKDFLNTIEEVSGLRVCLYDMADLIKKDKKLSVEDMWLYHNRPFCMAVKSTDIAYAKCIESDRKTPLNSVKAPIWRTCHAGLSELVIPITVKGKYLGSIVAGQVFLKKPGEKEIDEKLKYLSSLGVDPGKVKETIKETPVASDEKLKMALNLLDILVNYIVEVEEKFDWQEELKKIKASYALREFESGKEGLRYLIKKVKKVKDLRYNNIIEQTLAKLQDMPVKSIRLKEVAKNAGFSPFHFSRVFKETKGVNFREYLAGLRISKAKELMKDVNLNLSDIAYASGYEDLSSFSRNFKKITGVNPGKYREKIVNKTMYNE